MTIHTLKIKETYAKLHLSGLKDWELRYMDRDYKVDDEIHFIIVSDDTLQPINNVGYKRKITYIYNVPNTGLKFNYAILSLSI